MDDWNQPNLSEEVRRGNNRSQIDQSVCAFIAGAMMLGTIVGSVVIAFKTGSLMFGGICFLAGIGGIIGFGAVFWRDRT